MDPSTSPAETPIVESELYRVTERSLRAAPPDEEGFVAPRAAGAFDVVVGAASVDRALLALRLLLEQADQAGLRVAVDAKTRRTNVHIGDERVEICLRERRRQVKHRVTPEDRKQNPTKKEQELFLPRWDVVPSGEMSIRVKAPAAHGARRRWALGSDSRLPSQVATCVRQLPQIIESRRVAAIEDERQARELAERRQRELEEEHHRAEERHRRQLLLEEAAAWQKSQALRSYIEGIRARFDKQRDPDQQAKLDRWISWATDIADSLDPVIQAEATHTERAMPSP